MFTLWRLAIRWGQHIFRHRTHSLLEGASALQRRGKFKKEQKKNNNNKNEVHKLF